MLRRDLVVWAASVAALWAAPAGGTVRGKLTQQETDHPALRRPDGTVVDLSGDKQTTAVLQDPRLKELEIELVGQAAAPKGPFTIEPIYKKAIFAYKDGQRYRVSYWCDICSIRSSSPGKCWCCQQETRLDLIDPNAP